MKKNNKVNPLTHFNNLKASAIKKAGKEMSTYKKSLKKAQDGGGLYGTPTLKERGINNVYQGPLNEGDTKILNERYPLTTGDMSKGPRPAAYSRSEKAIPMSMEARTKLGDSYYKPVNKLQSQQAGRERLENLIRSNDPLVQQRNKKYGNFTGKNGMVDYEGTPVDWTDVDVNTVKAMKNIEGVKGSSSGLYVGFKKGGPVKRKRK